MDEHLGEDNVNMVTCGGQATIPIVHAVRRVSDSVPYAEIIASISSNQQAPERGLILMSLPKQPLKGLKPLAGPIRARRLLS